MSGCLYTDIYDAIMQPDPTIKSRLASQIHQDWDTGKLVRHHSIKVESIDIPGRPPEPELVDPRQVSRRTLATEEGRQVLLHSFAHIEFNAINLALDAAYRFRDMPDRFISDWLKVASEEAHHFTLLNDYLLDLDSRYGAYKAHNGLWDMVCKTRHDVLHRMALVPRVMEARGLDVTPGMMKKFAAVGDMRAVEILRVIFDEEIGHVAIGNRWYHFCCAERELDAQITFQQLIEQYFEGKLRGPFNREARLAAGFEEFEINALENSL